MRADEPKVEDRRILVGVVGAPHGVKGEVRVKSYMQVPTAIGGHALYTAATGGTAIRMASVRLLKDDMVVARMTGIADRDAALVLRGKPLFIDRASLEPTGEDEFYNADLIGLPVATTAGEPVGLVVGVVDYGAGDLLEVRTEAGPTILIPFLMRFVPVVDLAQRRVAITPEALMPGEDDEAPADPDAAEGTP